MFRDRWKSKGAAAKAEAPPPRTSNGLGEFFSSIQGLPDLSILDFAGANQANISFITALGHRVYSDDVLRALDDCFGPNSGAEEQSDPARVEAFLEQSLDFPVDTFDGALVWDTLQFLSPPLLERTLRRMYHVLRPGASLLAFFNADERTSIVPVHNYRILDAKTLSLTARGTRKTGQFFNNRALEKLFADYKSVKFFLTRDHLREMIVKR